jgi:hypothetical protein
MSGEIFGSETRCCVCGSETPNTVSEGWYENQTDFGKPARKVWRCGACASFLRKAVESAGSGHEAVSFWTRERNERAIQRAREYYKAVQKAPAATAPEVKLAAKPSWEDHQKHEREVAASQHAIDAEARLRQVTHDLDRPSTPRYSQAYLTADMGGNPWSRR